MLNKIANVKGNQRQQKEFEARLRAVADPYQKKNELLEKQRLMVQATLSGAAREPVDQARGLQDRWNSKFEVVLKEHSPKSRR